MFNAIAESIQAMQPRENEKVNPEKRSRKPRMSFDLYYYEQTVAGRYHLRITPLALILILIAMAVGFTILWLDGRQQTIPDVKITVPSPTPYSTNPPIIQQAPPPSINKVARQPKANVSIPSPTMRTKSSNEQ